MDAKEEAKLYLGVTSTGVKGVGSVEVGARLTAGASEVTLPGSFQKEATYEAGTLKVTSSEVSFDNSKVSYKLGNVTMEVSQKGVMSVSVSNGPGFTKASFDPVGLGDELRYANYFDFGDGALR
jgi:hypothetical protein